MERLSELGTERIPDAFCAGLADCDSGGEPYGTILEIHSSRVKMASRVLQRASAIPNSDFNGSRTLYPSSFSPNAEPLHHSALGLHSDIWYILCPEDLILSS
jgi:hypothetical protein